MIMNMHMYDLSNIVTYKKPQQEVHWYISRQNTLVNYGDGM